MPPLDWDGMIPEEKVGGDYPAVSSPEYNVFLYFTPSFPDKPFLGNYGISLHFGISGSLHRINLSVIVDTDNR